MSGSAVLPLARLVDGVVTRSSEAVPRAFAVAGTTDVPRRAHFAGLRENRQTLETWTPP